MDNSIRIKLIGIGGAGCNSINRLYTHGVHGAKTVALNTDRLHLETVSAEQKLVIGKNVTKERGAGGDPEKGRLAAEESSEDIRKVVEDSEIVFVSAGLGGGTGTGGAPVVAKVARETGAIVIGTVTLPFKFEGPRRRKIALKGLDDMKRECNTLIVIQNDKLLELYPTYTINNAFFLVDEVIYNMIQSITEAITKPSMINIDFADFKTIVQSGKIASLGIGRSSSPNRAEEATLKALHSPLLDITYNNLSGAIVHVTGSDDMKLSEASRPGEIVSELMGEDSLVIWGARIDEKFASSLQVSLILTGVTHYDSESLQEAKPAKEGRLNVPNVHKLLEGIDRISEELGISREAIESLG